VFGVLIVGDEPAVLRVLVRLVAVSSVRVHGARRLLLIWLTVPLLLAACRGGDMSSDAVTAIEAVPTLVVADEPDVRIGLTKGKGPYLLSLVTGATRLSDGTIVVADCGSAALRYFDASGRFVRTVGGRGRGPGEFSWILRIFPVGGDTIGVDDSDRVTVLAPDGALVHTFPSLVGGYLNILGRLANGLFVAKAPERDARVEFGGQFWETDTLLLLDATGQRVDSLVGLRRVEVRETPNTPTDRIGGLRLRRMASLAVYPEGIYYGAQDSPRIIVFDHSLRQVDTIGTITEPAPVTEEVKRAFQAMVDEGAQYPTATVIRGFPSEDYAPAMAAYGDLIAGRDGALWVEDPLRPAHYPLVWTAYEDGRPVARAELPPRFFPFEFGRDWVLGVSFDDFNVERVELWRLVPGELPGLVLPPRDAAPPILHRCSVGPVR
jgi:hypothetical protein